jgi:hypothetical protein
MNHGGMAREKTHSHVAEGRRFFTGALAFNGFSQENHMHIRDEEKRARVREECTRRGVRITPYGKALWLNGHGVSIVCGDLAYLNLKELDSIADVFIR